MVAWPVAVAITFSGLDQLVDLGLGQVLALAVSGVRTPARGNCSLFAGWRYHGEVRYRVHLPTPSIHYCSYNAPKATLMMKFVATWRALRAAVVAAKARGERLGALTLLSAVRRMSTVRKAQAAQFAANVLPIIRG